MAKTKPFKLSIVTRRQIALFEEKIDRSGDCWLWTASTLNTGYGQFHVGHRSSGTLRTTTAHRLAWMLAHPNANIGGLCICHHCDNPLCCRPSHLFIGTHGDNARDRQAKGRGNQCRGEEHAKSYITNDDVRAIRASGESNRATGEKYGMGASGISKIKNRRAWAHVR